MDELVAFTRTDFVECLNADGYLKRTLSSTEFPEPSKTLQTRAIPSPSSSLQPHGSMKALVFGKFFSLQVG